MKSNKMGNLSQRIFYTACFFAFGLIDLYRNMFIQHICNMVINLTGIVILLLIISGMKFRKKCVPYYLIWTLVSGAGLMIWSKWFLTHPQSSWIYTPLMLYLNVYFWGVLIISVIGNFKQLRPRKITLLGVLWIIFTVLTVASENEAIWPLWYFLLFGAFYCVDFGEEKRKNLCTGLLNGTILSFGYIQLYAYIHRPWDELRYKGAYANCNRTALFYVIVFSVLLIKLHVLHKENASGKKKGVVVFLAAFLLSLQIYTLCRTALIVSAAVLILYVFLVMHYLWKDRIVDILRKGLIFIGCLLVAFPLTYLTIRYIPAYCNDPVWHPGEYSEKKVQLDEPIDSPKYIDFKEFTEEAFRRLFVRKGTPGKIDTDKMLSNRGAIYKLYLKNLNWTGHSRTATETWKGAAKWHAHDFWLQVSFSFGIPAGIIFLLMMLIILKRGFFRALQKTEDGYSLIPLFLTVTVLIYGLTESVWQLGQYSLVLLYLVQHPQLTENLSGYEKRSGTDEDRTGQ